MTQRDTQQARLGELRRREQVLAAEVSKQEAALTGFDNELRREEGTLRQLQANLRSLQMRRDAQEAEVRACKSHWYSIDWMCDAAADIAKLIGEFKDVSADIDIAQRRVAHAHEGMRLAEQRRDQAKTALEKAVSEARGVDIELRETEGQLVHLHATLATLRADVQAYQRVLDDFEHALAESARVDTADGRARSARKVRDIAARIDSSLAQTSQVIAAAHSKLPPGASFCSVAPAFNAGLTHTK